MSPELLEHVRNALPEDDPYRSIIEEHRAELRAHHHPVVFVASDNTQQLAYAFLSQLATKNEAFLDLVIPPHPHETEIATALLDRVLAETNVKISWWTRAPRLLHSDELSKAFGGGPHRTVLRMERELTTPIDVDLQTRAFTDADAAEMVRINNEAFARHPDRANITEDALREQMRVLGNRYEDLRLIEGGFCWAKRQSTSESELFVLAVDDAHRHAGLGQKLLLATLEYVRTQHQVQRASLYVEFENVKAVKLYERNGFVNTGSSLHSVVFPER